jgi:hypothetical protein
MNGWLRDSSPRAYPCVSALEYRGGPLRELGGMPYIELGKRRSTRLPPRTIAAAAQQSIFPQRRSRGT